MHTSLQKNQIFNILAEIRQSVLRVAGPCLASGQQNLKEALQRWRVVGETVFDLTGTRIEPMIFRIHSAVYYHCTNRLVYLQRINFQ